MAGLLLQSLELLIAQLDQTTTFGKLTLELLNAIAQLRVGRGFGCSAIACSGGTDRRLFRLSFRRRHEAECCSLFGRSTLPHLVLATDLRHCLAARQAPQFTRIGHAQDHAGLQPIDIADERLRISPIDRQHHLASIHAGGFRIPSGNAPERVVALHRAV